MSVSKTNQFVVKEKLCLLFDTLSCPSMLRRHGLEIVLRIPLCRPGQRNTFFYKSVDPNTVFAENTGSAPAEYYSARRDFFNIGTYEKKNECVFNWPNGSR